MRESYDVIIIGAGHNGLTLGAYLARSGLEVLVLERRHEEGGGLTTEELTRPGFLHNVHANYHTFVDLAPPVKDLEIREHGVKYVRPEVQMASIYPDKTALVVYSDIDKTCDSISRFSAKDAATFRKLFNEAHGYVDLLLGTLMFEPPMSVKELTKALSVFGVGNRSEFLSVKLRRETINQFLDEHFESPKVKAHLAFHGAVCGYANDIVGLAIGFPLLVGKINNWHLSIGGSHRLAHALWRDLANHGGVLVTDAEVASVVVDGNRVSGVRLADGTEITARKLVASTVSVEQTFLEFLDRDKVSNDLVSNELFEKIETEIKHQSWSLFSVHLALSKLPHYLAGEFEPDVDKAWVVNLGYSSPEELNDDWKLIRNNQLADPKPNVAINSLYDPTDAPEGSYTGLLRQFAPYSIGSLGPGAWVEEARHYGEKCIESWRAFAPDMDAEAIIDWTTYSPHDIATKLPNMVKGDWMMGEISLANMLDQRPLPELGNYRTPIEGLYMAGSTQHPHGFITFAPAYNALSVIAQDIGLDQWWKKV
ncbi:MAG: NAD(P)/FAD-dependent oxidoreductase [Acidimicrobiales bacterium]|nr:NAD(P)/FAD-dependent oxidoreductase [Acidimicrobiales bacterium]